MPSQRRSRRHPAFDDKVKEGSERNKAWQELTPAAKVGSLDRRLGKDQGAKRQRAKFQLLEGGRK